MPLAIILAAALWSQDPTAGLSIERNDATLELRLGGGLVVEYRLQPALVLAVQLGGARARAGELRVDGAAPVAAELLDTRVEADHVVLELALRSKVATLRATDTFRALPLAGSLGVERRFRAQRREAQSDLLELVTPLDAREPGFEPPRPARTVERYGVSTVSEPGTTTSLTRAMQAEGVTLWSFRAGIEAMAQSMNLGLDVEWTEVLILLPSSPDEAGDERVGAALLQALVEDPHDRRALVRDWSASQHHLLYETPVERVLDPALGSSRGAGSESDPWPAFVECHGRALATLLAPGSRLVLRSGDHGDYRPTDALLVGADPTGAAPAILKGLDAARTEGYDVNRARVTLRLADAVTVELWGDPLVARWIATPAGRIETSWEAVRQLDPWEHGKEAAVARTPELRLSRDQAQLGLLWEPRRHGPRSGTDHLRALEVAGTWGVVRRIAVARDHLEGLESLVIAPEPSVPMGRPLDKGSRFEKVLGERGVYWDICRFAVTYVVLKERLADGSTHWWIRFGQLPFDQATDCGNAIDLVEATFLASPASKLNLGELLAAVVENDVDRRALLRAHAPAVFDREYGRDD